MTTEHKTLTDENEWLWQVLAGILVQKGPVHLEVEKLRGQPPVTVRFNPDDEGMLHCFVEAPAEQGDEDDRPLSPELGVAAEDMRKPWADGRHTAVMGMKLEPVEEEKDASVLPEDVTLWTDDTGRWTQAPDGHMTFFANSFRILDPSNPDDQEAADAISSAIDDAIKDGAIAGMKGVADAIRDDQRDGMRSFNDGTMSDIELQCDMQVHADFAADFLAATAVAYSHLTYEEMRQRYSDMMTANGRIPLMKAGERIILRPLCQMPYSYGASRAADYVREQSK